MLPGDSALIWCSLSTSIKLLTDYQRDMKERSVSFRETKPTPAMTDKPPKEPAIKSAMRNVPKEGQQKRTLGSIAPGVVNLKTSTSQRIQSSEKLNPEFASSQNARQTNMVKQLGVYIHPIARLESERDLRLMSKEKNINKRLSLRQQLHTSYAMTHILSYLTPSDQIRYQGLNRFFYEVQARAFLQQFPVANYKRRLHLLNQDYLLLFNFEDMSKHKFIVNNFQQLWNHQSIEVRGKIYSTGGAIANSKVYLKSCQVLDELTMAFTDLAPMHYERDAHGICTWRDRYIICAGSWHGPGARTCEIYDVETNIWKVLPQLNEGTCAPGLCVFQDKLYKLGGTSDIGKVEVLDLICPKQWITVNTSNRYGRKHTINRCLLHPIPQALIQGERNEDEGKFLVLGCHFGRSEKPFIYDIRTNKYTQFQDKEHLIDMYRSNDVVQFSQKSICIRPFVKVGERPENVKVYQYFLQDQTENEAAAFGSERRRSRSIERQRRNDPSQFDLEQLDGPRRGSYLQPQKKSLKGSGNSDQNSAQASQGIFSRLSSLFTSGKRQSQQVACIKQGTLQEVTFKSGVWQASFEAADA